MTKNALFYSLFCRYYYLAFRAHQTPLANKESCVAILEKSRLDHWVLGKTKVGLSLLFRLSPGILYCVPLSLVSNMNDSVSQVAQQTRPRHNSDLCWSWVRSPRTSGTRGGACASCSAGSIRTIQYFQNDIFELILKCLFFQCYLFQHHIQIPSHVSDNNEYLSWFLAIFHQTRVMLFIAYPISSLIVYNFSSGRTLHLCGIPGFMVHSELPYKASLSLVLVLMATPLFLNRT